MEQQKTFFEIEKIQKKKLWALFAVIIGFYMVTVTILLLIGLVFTAFVDPRAIIAVFSGSAEGLLFLLSVFGISILAGLGHWYYSMRKGPQKILENAEAHAPDPEDRYHQLYRNIVDEIAIAMGEPNLKAMVLNTTAMNALSVKSLHGDGVVALTEGAISRLNRSQLQAMVAQGVARCATGEAVIATAACSLAGVYESTLEKLKDSRRKIMDNNSGRHSEFPIMLIAMEIAMVFLHGIFSFLNLCLSRENGIKADATSVRLTRHPLALAEAFYISSHNWRGGGVHSGLAPLYALPGGDRRHFDEAADDSWLENIFKTHPPTRKRIEALLQMARERETALEKALKLAATSPPITQEASQLSIEGEGEWMVREGKDWKGPFGVQELLRLPFLNMDSWVRPSGEEEKFFPVYSVPEFADHFRGKEEGRYSCPLCKVPLVTAEKAGLKISQCPDCQGVLVGKNKTVRIVARRELSFPESLVKEAENLPSWLETRQAAQASEDKHSCPQCQKEMIRSPFNLAYPVEVDRCSACDLVWFDNQELEMIQYLMQKSRIETMTG